VTKTVNHPPKGQLSPPEIDVVSNHDPRDRGGPAQPLFIVKNLVKNFPVRGGLSTAETKPATWRCKSRPVAGH